jgi:hypothetical protein
MISSIQTYMQTTYPDYDGVFSIGWTLVKEQRQPVEWPGIDWTAQLIAARLMWLGLTLLLVCAAALRFQRFQQPHNVEVGVGSQQPSETRAAGTAGENAAPLFAVPNVMKLPSTYAPGPLPLVSLDFAFGAVVLAELRLMLKGLRWWWYGVMAGLIVASLVAPLGITREFMLPLAWVWPIALWSAMGVREARYQTDVLVFSTAYPLRYQLLATWLTGVLVTAVAGSGALLRLALAHEVGAQLGWIAGALFIPTLALALGVWSKTGKVFEACYKLL